LQSDTIKQDKMIDQSGSSMEWTMKWTISRVQIISAGVAIVAFIVGAGLLFLLDVPEVIHFTMDDGGVSVKESTVSKVSGEEHTALQPPPPQYKEDDPFSFRLRRSWSPGMTWEYSLHGWCLQCKTKVGRNETCLDGDKIVIGHCSKKRPQRFTYEELRPGVGRLKPLAAPNLCLTMSGRSQAIRLSRCQRSNLLQLFAGFDPGHAFELQAMDNPKLCLVVPRTDELAFVSARCSKARNFNRTLWEAVYQEGRYDGHIPSTKSCPRTCLNVFQRNKEVYVGQFQPVTTSQGVDLFYQYNAKNLFGYNAEEITPLDAETSIIFVHQDAMYCDLALVTVHGAKELKAGQECTPGGAILFITGNLENSIVQDGRNSPSDSYTYIPATDETNCNWTWSWQTACQVRTDGLAHLWEPQKLPCIKIRPQRFIGIDHWMYVPGLNASDVPISFDQYVPLDMNEDLEICTGLCN
jgi:hypothetical protein